MSRPDSSLLLLKMSAEFESRLSSLVTFFFMIFQLWLWQPVRCFLKMFSLLLLDLSLAGTLPPQKVTGVFSLALGPKGATEGKILCGVDSLWWFIYLETLNLDFLVGRLPDLETEGVCNFQQTDHSWIYGLRTYYLWQNRPWSRQGPKKSTQDAGSLTNSYYFEGFGY